MMTALLGDGSQPQKSSKKYQSVLHTCASDASFATCRGILHLGLRRIPCDLDFCHPMFGAWLNKYCITKKGVSNHVPH